LESRHDRREQVRNNTAATNNLDALERMAQRFISVLQRNRRPVFRASLVILVTSLRNAIDQPLVAAPPRDKSLVHPPG